MRVNEFRSVDALQLSSLDQFSRGAIDGSGPISLSVPRGVAIAEAGQVRHLVNSGGKVVGSLLWQVVSSLAEMAVHTWAGEMRRAGLAIRGPGSSIPRAVERDGGHADGGLSDNCDSMSA